MGIASTKISPSLLVPICRSLATSYDAGITIKDGLKLASGHARGKHDREIFLGMAEDIQNGASLAEAAASRRKYLPEFFVQLLAAGEVGGRLDVMLRDLAEYYEDRQKLVRAVVVSMVLPVLYLMAAWYLGSFALGIITHLSLTETFDFKGYLEKFMLFQLAAHIGLVVLVVVSIILARLGIFKWIIGWVTNFIWPFKSVTRRFALARFFRSMSLLIGSGLGIQHCIRNAAAVTANPYIRRDLERSIPHVMDGSTLVQAFSFSKSLTPTAREMLAVGEHSGNLDVALRKVAQYHQEEAMQAVHIAIRVLFVLVMLGVGILIGAVVIMFWTNYFAMFDEIM